MTDKFVDGSYDEDAEDAAAARIAQGLTVEEQNYNFSCAARDKVLLSLNKNTMSTRPIVEKKIIDMDSCVTDCPPLGLERGRRGRGIFGMNARRNRAAG